MTYSVRKKDYGANIDLYIDMVYTGAVETNDDIKKAMAYVERRLDNDYVFIDSKKTENAILLMEKYFDMKLFEWEKFVIALVHCYDTRDNTVLFSTFFLMMGRGNGKNGFISCLAWYLSTHYHGVEEYNIDIIANGEDQAKTSFDDISLMLEKNWTGTKEKPGLSGLFYKSKVLIECTATNSYIKYNTSNAKTKDGKRSGCLIFDEVHEYENFDLINVFESGFGKKKHSRTFYITTQGHLRGGVLDELLEITGDVLNGDSDELGILPLPYRINTKSDAKDPDKWVMANPSLPYLPTLRKKMEKDYSWMLKVPSKAVEFFTKRMNLPAQDAYAAVATYEQVKATNRPIPLDSLRGMDCVGAVDYAELRDFTSVGLLFKKDGLYYWHEHTFVCYKALEPGMKEIKFPVREMAERGLITIVQDDLIRPELVADWFEEMAHNFNIVDIRTDLFRLSALRATFEAVGLPLTAVRNGIRTHNELAPLISSLFAQEKLVFGDNPTMRWYIGNVYTDRDKKENITYKKIEPQVRKTDGFFALLHALTGEEKLADSDSVVSTMMPAFF